MFAFMGNWPALGIFSLSGAVFGVLGGLVSQLFARNNKKASIIVAVIAMTASRPVTEQYLLPRIANDTANADLPKKIDDITTMTKIIINNRAVVYSYEIDPSVSLVAGEEMRASVGPSACQYWKPKFQAGEFVSAEYSYKFKEGSSSFVLNNDNCP